MYKGCRVFFCRFLFWAYFKTDKMIILSVLEILPENGIRNPDDMRKKMPSFLKAQFI